MMTLTKQKQLEAKKKAIASKQYREMRTLQIARYIIVTRCSIREAGKHFKVACSTIHRYMTVYLPEIHNGLAIKITEIFQYNFATRHLKRWNKL